MKVKHFALPLIFLVFAALMISCSGKTFVAYSGPAAPKNEIANIKLAKKLTLKRINGVKPTRPMREPNIETKPGPQILKLGTVDIGLQQVTHCDDGSTRQFDLSMITEDFGGFRRLEFTVEAGHQYLIDSKFVRNKTVWETKVTDVTDNRPISADIDDSGLKLVFEKCIPKN